MRALAIWLTQPANFPGDTLTEVEMTALLPSFMEDFIDLTSPALGHVRAGETITPNPATRAYHDAKYTVWRDLYDTQKRHRGIMDP